MRANSSGVFSELRVGGFSHGRTSAVSAQWVLFCGKGYCFEQQFSTGKGMSEFSIGSGDVARVMYLNAERYQHRSGTRSTRCPLREARSRTGVVLPPSRLCKRVRQSR